MNENPPSSEENHEKNEFAEILGKLSPRTKIAVLTIIMAITAWQVLDKDSEKPKTVEIALLLEELEKQLEEFEAGAPEILKQLPETATREEVEAKMAELREKFTKKVEEIDKTAAELAESLQNDHPELEIGEVLGGQVLEITEPDVVDLSRRIILQLQEKIDESSYVIRTYQITERTGDTERITSHEKPAQMRGAVKDYLSLKRQLDQVGQDHDVLLEDYTEKFGKFWLLSTNEFSRMMNLDETIRSIIEKYNENNDTDPIDPATLEEIIDVSEIPETTDELVDQFYDAFDTWEEDPTQHPKKIIELAKIIGNKYLAEFEAEEKAREEAKKKSIPQLIAEYRATVESWDGQTPPEDLVTMMSYISDKQRDQEWKMRQQLEEAFDISFEELLNQFAEATFSSLERIEENILEKDEKFSPDDRNMFLPRPIVSLDEDSNITITYKYTTRHSIIPKEYDGPKYELKMYQKLEIDYQQTATINSMTGEITVTQAEPVVHDRVVVDVEEQRKEIFRHIEPGSKAELLSPL